MNYKQYTDTELIDKVRNGKSKDKEKGFTVLYERYSSAVHGFCKSMVRNSQVVEDIFQETFIRFYKKLEQGLEVRNPSAFLITIARNLSLNYHRDKKDTVQVEDVPFIFDADNSYEKKELLELVMNALDVMDYKYKEAFVLKKIDGYSVQEISDIIGISEEGVKTRIRRARKMLLEILDPYLKDNIGK